MRTRGVWALAAMGVCLVAGHAVWAQQYGEKDRLARSSWLACRGGSRRVGAVRSRSRGKGRAGCHRSDWRVVSASDSC